MDESSFLSTQLLAYFPEHILPSALSLAFYLPRTCISRPSKEAHRLLSCCWRPPIQPTSRHHAPIHWYSLLMPTARVRLPVRPSVRYPVRPFSRLALAGRRPARRPVRPYARPPAHISTCSAVYSSAGLPLALFGRSLVRWIAYQPVRSPVRMPTRSPARSPVRPFARQSAQLLTR